MRKSDDGDYRPRAFGEGALPATAASNSADSEDPWAGWNNWADARADNRIQAAFDEWLCGLIAEAVTTEGNELIAIVREAFKKRDKEISELRGKLDMLASLLMKSASADVVTLPTGRKHA
jgi:hypothetical protein